MTSTEQIRLTEDEQDELIRRCVEATRRPVGSKYDATWFKVCFHADDVAVYLCNPRSPIGSDTLGLKVVKDGLDPGTYTIFEKPIDGPADWRAGVKKWARYALNVLRKHQALDDLAAL